MLRIDKGREKWVVVFKLIPTVINFDLVLRLGLFPASANTSMVRYLPHAGTS